QVLTKEAEQLLAVGRIDRLEAVVVDDPERLRLPILPAVLANAGEDVLTELAGQWCAREPFGRAAAPRTGNRYHPDGQYRAGFLPGGALRTLGRELVQPVQDRRFDPIPVDGDLFEPLFDQPHRQGRVRRERHE